MLNLDQKVLKLLNKEHFLSGQKMADQLGVSRTAVWKSIQNLKRDGYKVESVTNKGYMLTRSSDKLTETLLSSMISQSDLFTDIIYRESVDSTQKVAFQYISEKQQPFIVVSNEQTEGRGRFNREWLSPKSSGLYMSAVLKPDIELNEIIKFNLFISLAIARAIEKSFNLQTGIKWPNDIYINDKKVCGFLTEVLSENNMIQSIICGIGINLYETQSVKEINNATSIESELRKNDRMDIEMELFLNHLVKEIEHYYELFLSTPFSTIKDDWVSKSIIFGRGMRISETNRSYMGKPVDITDDGFLVVTDETGEIHKIISADIEF